MGERNRCERTATTAGRRQADQSRYGILSRCPRRHELVLDGFNPSTRLFYVMAVEDCNIYQQSKLGGYVPFRDPANPPEKYLRALDVETGKIVWEIPQVGPPESNYSGVLSTAGGLVFYGETGGGFAAVDAKTGKTLWHFETNEAWKASPMTYTMNGRQYVAIASGSSILSFALKE